jgi:hypothetical protein
MALSDADLDAAMLCVFSALFVEFSEGGSVTADDVRRAMWPKGVPKVAEVVARHCCLALTGMLDAQPETFEQIGQTLYMQITERVNEQSETTEREGEI